MDTTETITPIDYAYRVRSKVRKAYAQAREARMPKALVQALAHTLKLAEGYVDTFSQDDEEPSNPVPVAPPKPAGAPKAPVAPRVLTSEDKAQRALEVEIAALKKANASLKASITSAENAAA